jgi:quercetin dioxygenase-like cupin family protein
MNAAPDFHELLLENEKVRVLDSLLRPGESTPVHTHRWPSVLYVIGFSDFVRKDADGAVLFDSRQSETKPAPGQAFWSGPLSPHNVTNVGKSDIRIISVEIKPQSKK